MIDLKLRYGDQVLDKSFFMKHLGRVRFVEGILLDAVLALVVIQFFDIKWSYAFIKVYAFFFLYGILRFVFSLFIETFNYHLLIKDWLATQMTHYIKLFDKKINWDRIGTYDDFLLDSAYNPFLEIELRILAAMQYVHFLVMVKDVPLLEDRCYRLFGKVEMEHLEPNQSA